MKVEVVMYDIGTGRVGDVLDKISLRVVVVLSTMKNCVPKMVLLS